MSSVRFDLMRIFLQGIYREQCTSLSSSLQSWQQFMCFQVNDNDDDNIYVIDIDEDNDDNNVDGDSSFLQLWKQFMCYQVNDDDDDNIYVTVWCNQMGTVCVEMSSRTALTRHMRMKTTFYTKYIKANMFVLLLWWF